MFIKKSAVFLLIFVPVALATFQILRSLSLDNEFRSKSQYISWAINREILPELWWKNPELVLLSTLECKLNRESDLSEKPINTTPNILESTRKVCRIAFGTNRQRNCGLWWARTDCIPIRVLGTFYISDRNVTKINNVAKNPCPQILKIFDELNKSNDVKYPGLLVDFRHAVKSFGCEDGVWDNPYNVIFSIDNSDEELNILDKRVYPEFSIWRVFL